MLNARFRYFLSVFVLLVEADGARRLFTSLKHSNTNISTLEALTVAFMTTWADQKRTST